MNIKRGIGFGLLLWVIMFVVASVFVAFNMQDATLLSVLMLVISAVAVFILAGYVMPKSFGQALSYGLLWAVVGIILDYLISVKFAPDMFSSAYYWISYLLVVLVPMLKVKKEAVQAQ